MRLFAGPSARPSAAAGMKLARLLELPERAVEDRLRELEGDPLFRKLKDCGALAFGGDTTARFAARRAAGYALRASGEGLADALDGRGHLTILIERIGREAFTQCFLGSEADLTDSERARRCGVSEAQARELRSLVDRLYVQAEMESSGSALPQAAPPALSAVAGISIENGRPVLGFFHRDVWKGSWRVDAVKKRLVESTLSPKERRRVEALLKELDQLDRRRSTLSKVLDTMLAVQADYLTSGDPARRRPLTQRALAAEAGADPSVINRLIANKCVELPWGLEAPLRAFVPSAKALLRDRLAELAADRPGLSDEGLREELRRRHGARLSRRSVAQYRKELGLAPKRLRSPA